MVARDTGLRGTRRISHAFVFDLPSYPKLLALEAMAAKDPRAAYDLGLRFFRGDGVKKDSYLAIKWMRDAGERGGDEEGERGGEAVPLGLGPRQAETQQAVGPREDPAPDPVPGEAVLRGPRVRRLIEAEERRAARQPPARGARRPSARWAPRRRTRTG